ncbi:MAG: long-chain fatty acid--CoA ligase [Acidobacteria bacterium]|nr:long-chain fatty acid--CoA ligase [Acidobacteriota bacterium]
MERIWTKHYDQGVPPDLALQDLNLVDIFERSAGKWPDRPAVTLKGKTLTYAQLKDQVDRFATGLSNLGVGVNSRVALWLPNLPQSVIAYMATLKLGAQVVNTNPLYMERELEHHFNDSGVSVVVTLDFLWWYKLRGMMNKVGVKHVVVSSIPDYLPFPLNFLAPLKLKKTNQYVKVPREKGVHFFKELAEEEAPAPPRPEIPMDHPALLQYTGGTTGVSKGAVLTHRNLSANVQQAEIWFPTMKPGEEVLLACLPYFHVFGMTVSMLWPIAIGAQIITVPNPRDIKDLVDSIKKYRVSIFPAVPALFTAINNYPGLQSSDVASVKACFSGSAPLAVETLRRFEELTGGKITEGFGMTETSPVTHVNPLHGLRKAGSVGVPVPGTDMKIVDKEDGVTELGVGQEGELCVKGPQVMQGYWQRPDETAKVLENGWMHTGDLARVDEDGYTFIVGRKKDMILAGGYNVYPDEVDNVLTGHPAVLEAATIGVPDERCGEAVKSFIVLRPGASAEEDEIRHFCKESLAAYKVPKLIEFIPELPKSSMMKILRKDLRERELAKMAAAKGGS